MCALCHLVEVLLLISIIASASAALEPACSGHGVLSNGSSGVCECDPPYQGEQCELCAQGFYGDGRAICYLDCSTGIIKMLSGFSLAGVGVAPEQFGQASLSRLSDFCIAVIAPGLARAAESAETLSSFLNASSLLPELQLTLQFHGDAHSPCATETVLIYRGLPEFLGAEERLFSTAEGRLLASFTGDRLMSASLVTEAAVVTVVYHRTSRRAAGFNLTVSATALNETTAEAADECAWPCLLLGSAPSCDCSPPAPGPSYHTLLSALQGAASYNQSVTPNNSSADVGYCSGRYHHSMVYDPCSQSLWLYGGRGLSSGCGHLDQVTAITVTTGEVRVQEGEGPTPERRYLHSAVLLPCSPGSPSSRMLVFGGFTEGAGEGNPAPSDELWQFKQSQWTQLTSAPPGNALAGHSAVMAGGEMIVVGGVGAGLRMSPRILRYDLTSDSWEVLTTGALGPAGLYGHSAVYDAASDSVLVFGGYGYSRPQASPSPALFSLHLGTRQWTRLQTASQPTARVFHSAVLVGGYLVLHGGLVEEGGGACASGDVTLIAMDTTCWGRSVVTLTGEVISGDSPPPLWGHAAAVVDGHILVSGGLSRTALDSVALLSLPDSLECPLAQTEEECLGILDCAYCEPSTGSAGQCYNASDLDAPACKSNSTLGPRDPTCDATSQCPQFDTCRQCLSADTAQLLGCLWCGCSNQPGFCVAAHNTGFCTCTAVSSVNSSACYLDVCESPSCEGCMESEDCRWIGNTVERDADSYFLIRISSSAVEWGCYSVDIQNAIMNGAPLSSTLVSMCPPDCSQATSCQSCVQSASPNAGNLTCVWASYPQQCIPPDAVPLLCSEGTCGAVITNPIAGECPVPDPCSDSTDCLSCLQNPRCGWYQPNGEAGGICSGIDTPLLQENLDYYYLECPLLNECDAGVDDCGSEQICRDRTYGHECFCPDGYRENGAQCMPICINNCSGQGQCVAPGNCSCDLGFLGEDCGISCLCNGHSDCLPSDLAMCLQCLHNTQGPSCGECLPFHVGSPQEGSGCVPCLEYCHGNSEICLREEEFLAANNSNISLSMNQLIESEIVRDGPSEAEATCKICNGNSSGDSCETCEEGYFQLPTPGTNLVNCVRCRCNGYGDTCDPSDGSDCNCQNNTMTPFAHICPPPCFDSQCSTCLETQGYRGTPVNGSQCYKTELNINTISTFNLSANQTTFVAVPSLSFLYSDINVRVTLELEMGMMDVYVTDADQAIRVTVGENGEHVVSVRNGFDLLSVDAVDFLRLSDSAGPIVHQAVAENRLVVIIPFTDPQFQFKIEYFTFFARNDTKFHFYYRQDPPRLNLVVFFSVFLSSFCMVSCVTLLVWKLFRVFHRRRRALQRSHQRQLRANRPFESVCVYFDTSPLVPECCWALDSRCKKSELKKRNREPQSTSIPTLEPAQPTSTSQGERGDLKKSQLKKRRRVPADTADSIPTLELAQPRPRPQRVNLTDHGTGPIAVQPTCDNQAAVSTVLIQLPSHGSLSYAVCTGSTLVDCTSKDGSVRKRSRLTKRNKCAPAKAEVQTTPL